jgi:hypothetical protein
MHGSRGNWKSMKRIMMREGQGSKLTDTSSSRLFRLAPYRLRKTFPGYGYRTSLFAQRILPTQYVPTTTGSSHYSSETFRRSSAVLSPTYLALISKSTVLILELLACYVERRSTQLRGHYFLYMRDVSPRSELPSQECLLDNSPRSMRH